MPRRLHLFIVWSLVMLMSVNTALASRWYYGRTSCWQPTTYCQPTDWQPVSCWGVYPRSYSPVPASCCGEASVYEAPATGSCCEPTAEPAIHEEAAPSPPQPHEAQKPLTETPQPDLPLAPESATHESAAPAHRHTDMRPSEPPVAAETATPPELPPLPSETDVTAEPPVTESPATVPPVAEPPVAEPAEPEPAAVPAESAPPAELPTAAPGDTAEPTELDDLFDNSTEEAMPGEENRPAAEEDAPADGNSEDAKPDETPQNETEKDGTELDDIFGGASRRSGLSAPLAGGLDSRQLRRWTDNTGRYSCDGRLVRIGEAKVRILKENGRTTTVPLDRLSRDDLGFVRAQAALAADRSDMGRLARF